ncbi:MAG: hypothetical protein LBG52_04245 [Candidatus Peribacteria bacterium]|nr:hypothetical protein [Candidatus Peribacteria bacterium]
MVLSLLFGCMGIVDAIRGSINGFLNGKKDNSSLGFVPIFNTGTTNLARANLKYFLGTSFHSYYTTLTIGEKNSIISRSIDMLQESIQYVDMVDEKNEVVENSVAKQMLADANAIFGGDDFITYIYNSIIHEVCC